MLGGAGCWLANIGLWIAIPGKRPSGSAGLPPCTLLFRMNWAPGGSATPGGKLLELLANEVGKLCGVGDRFVEGVFVAGVIASTAIATADRKSEMSKTERTSVVPDAPRQRCVSLVFIGYLSR